MTKNEFIEWLEGLETALDVLGGKVSNQDLLQIVREKAHNLDSPNNLGINVKLPSTSWYDEMLDAMPGGVVYKSLKTWVNGKLVEDIQQTAELGEKK